MTWLRSSFAANPLPYLLIFVGVFTFGSQEGTGKADFTHLVSLLLIVGVIAYLAIRWDQDRRRS